MAERSKQLGTLRLIGSGGANRAMEAELKRLVGRALRTDRRSLTPKRLDEQTLLYPFSPEVALVAVQYLRTATRVLWDLYHIREERLEPLFEAVLSCISEDKRPWLEDELSLSVDTRFVRGFSASPLQVRGTIKNAFIEAAEERRLLMTLAKEEEPPDLPIIARGGSNDLTISIDLAGGSMHARGYRQHVGEAPLKETLAAQMLMLARWDSRSEALVDPMCGSGTIVIEAAAMAEGAPLWSKDRTPRATNLKPFRELKEANDWGRALFPGQKPPILGNDFDGEVITAAKHNLGLANLATPVQFQVGDFADLDLSEYVEQAPAKGGLIITNPPYGERLEAETETDVESLYRAFARWCESLPGRWRVAILTAHIDFDEIVGWRPVMRKPMSNGPLRTYFATYEF